MLRVKQFIFNPFEESTYLLVDDKTRKAAVVDPGMFDARENQIFDDFVKTHDIDLIEVINTHMHLDHCFGDNYVRDKYGVKVAANIGDAPFASRIKEQCSRFGFKHDAKPVDIDVPLKDGDIITIGESSLTVITVPGHSMGGIALYSAPDKLLIAGDSLFRGSIGRTDLEGGNHTQLVDNVTKKLLTLPDDTNVLPGHGPFTTIGHERTSNPFLQ